MEPIKTIKSRYAVLPVENIDTDQIIPARFLKGTTRTGLGTKAFFDLRYLADGSPNPEFVLNKPEFEGVQVLVAGDNFGCGSSREHAPWALVDFGLRVVLSTSIADIFRNNSLKNGFVPIEIDAAFHRELMAAPGDEVIIDLEAKTITHVGGSTVSFPIEAFARYRLLNGIDEFDFLMQQSDLITKHETEPRA